MKLKEILQSGNIEQIQKEITARFAKNIDFFANQKFDLTSPPQNYNLLFNDDGINIVNLKTNELVYPKIDGKHSMVDVNLHLCKNPLQNQKWNLYTNNLMLTKIDTKTFPITGEVCNSLIDILDEEGGGIEFHLPSNFLPSTNVFGLLDGMFLEFLREDGYFFHSLLIFEEEFDFFRISCYFVDYEKLFGATSPSSCYLFIKDLINKAFIRNYFEHKKITNNFLRLQISLYSTPKIDNAKDIVNEIYGENSRGWGSFEDEMIGVRNSIKNLQHYKVLKNPTRVNVPICVIGNGASLDGLLDFIKINQHKMIIFSCGTALKPLKKYGISPDFQVEIERVDYLKDVLENAPLGDTTLLCGSIVNPEALKISKEAYLFLRGGSSSGYLSKPTIEFASPFVGNAGVALACLLGSEVIACGIDCGYIKGKSKHSKNSYYGDEDTKIPNESYKVTGNFEDDVYSTPLFSLSNTNICNAISIFKPKNFLNLGNGAYIKGARPTKPEEFDLANIDKNLAIKTIKSYFCDMQIPDSYLDEMTKFRNDLLREFSNEIKDKKELFALIDKISIFCEQKSQNSPFIGILFRGSIFHILHTLMLCALHLPNNQIQKFYVRSISKIADGLDKFLMKYRILESQK